ncbi:MAG TPA: transporter substrate-binding domain-containing protein [Gaiellaceae bacterium]|jgi:polar amino acid transport system substrate-binding protein|nr:transporter substrate-binding domain-containing protein [Gaiellaceae bacterium]
MKRFALVTVLLAALVAVAATAFGTAAPFREGTTDARAKLPARPKLPALPAEVRSRGRWQIGVKCDTPPMGYEDTDGNHKGYDVEVAKQFARWAFGSANRVEYTCVTTASRIPTLLSKRVDIIIATITWTAEREQQIDFSPPYYGAVGRLLVRNDTTVGQLSTWMRGKKIASTSGSIYNRWISNCFKGTSFQVIASPSAGVLALKNRQVDAFMYDDSFLVGVAANDRDLKMSSHRFLNVPWGIGIRKGETPMKRWVDAAIRGMSARNMFWPIMRRTVPRRFYADFRKNVPSPTNKLRYPRATTPENNCPR